MRLIDADALLEALKNGITTHRIQRHRSPDLIYKDYDELVAAITNAPTVQEDVTKWGIQVEKKLCDVLGREWKPSGFSIETLIDDIQAKLINAPTVQQSEPFGYFKAEPFGWTDCAETDEGAIALYEAPPIQREGWVRVSDDMPKKACLAYYKNELGNGRTVKAKYVNKFSEEANTDDDWIEYNEADDTYYYPAGWYEMIDNWDDYAFVTINHQVTHWQSLPPAPTDKE